MMNRDRLEQVFTPKCTAVAYTDEVQMFPALFTIKAPVNDDDDVARRQPIDVVCVVDRSGSMSPHMDMLKETLTFITNQLHDGDNLCIVTYHSVVTTELPFTVIDSNSKERIFRVINMMRDEGCTNLAGGLFEGLHRMESGRKNRLGTVLLLTDGLANEGITQTSEILRRMRNRNFLRRYEDERTKVDKEMSADLATPNCSVYTFGFGRDHNVDMLHQIAECGRGLYSYVKSSEDIGAAFASALGGIMSTVAQNIEIDIEHGMNAKVVNVVSKYPTTKTDAGIRVVLPDMLCGEKRDIVCQLNISALDGEMAVEPVCSARVRYYHRKLDTNITEEPLVLGLCRLSRDNLQPHMEQPSLVVDAQINRLRAVEAMDRASALADQNAVDDARKLIDEAINNIRESVSRDEESVRQLLEDLQKSRAGLRDVPMWRSQGSKAMKGFFHGHSKQRANMQCLAAYGAAPQMKAMSSWFSRK